MVVPLAEAQAAPGVIYSVYNVGKLGYDYYENGSTATSANVEKPPHLVARTLGSTIDQAAWPLPSDAKLVGSGEHAIGRVASRSSRMPLGAFELGNLTVTKAALLGLSAFLLWRYVLPWRARRNR